VLVNVAVFGLWRFRTKRRTMLRLAMGLAILFLTPFVYGYLVIPRKTATSGVPVALLQANIDSNLKWDQAYTAASFAIFDTLALEAAAKGARLLIWPESSAPCYLRGEPVWLLHLQRQAALLKRPMLVGALDYDSPGAGQYIFYNAAFQFDSLGNLSPPYRKIHLVPVGERIPFRDEVTVLDKIQLGQADFTGGKEFTTFAAPFGRYGCLICFESVFPDLVRRFVLSGADFLVNITNDAWFGRTSGPYQHAQMVVFRAIENRISIARAANSGVSLLVDRWGRISARSPIFKRRAVVATLDPGHERTFYTAHGNWFAKLAAAVSLVVLGLAAFRKK
jgi:apolipoprotein N-acyltransferase